MLLATLTLTSNYWKQSGPLSKQWTRKIWKGVLTVKLTCFKQFCQSLHHERNLLFGSYIILEHHATLWNIL